ncbi:hypothetical protein [Thiothrix fructosivorans]|uniref:hypothetical protein n=1 Tax=Thiothrix fructosivorans TaxID=111770 RepID=UPI003556E6A8
MKPSLIMEGGFSSVSSFANTISTSDSPRTKRARIHQGWWRAFVLKKPAGQHPLKKDTTICNVLPDQTAGNFIRNRVKPRQWAISNLAHQTA